MVSQITNNIKFTWSLFKYISKDHMDKNQILNHSFFTTYSRTREFLTRDLYDSELSRRLCMDYFMGIAETKISVTKKYIIENNFHNATKNEMELLLSTFLVHVNSKEREYLLNIGIPMDYILAVEKIVGIEIEDLFDIVKFICSYSETNNINKVYLLMNSSENAWLRILKNLKKIQSEAVKKIGQIEYKGLHA